MLEIIRSMFYRDAYNEVIATVTMNDEFYSMPLGLRLSNNSLIARVFKGSRLYDVLHSRGAVDASICITSNPLLFYYAVVRKDSLRYRIIDNTPCIEDCDACIGGRLGVAGKANNHVRIVFEPHRILILNPWPHPYVRGSAALIEALVHYTKIPYVSRTEAARLIGFIEAAVYAVEKSTTDDGLREAIRDVYRRASKLLRELHGLTLR